MKAIETWIEESEAALQADPSDVTARANLAHAFQLQERYSEAEVQFERVMETAPTHELALNNYCALLEHGTDGLMRIEALCRRALARSGGHMGATIWLAKAMLLGLRADEGLKLLEQAVHPDFSSGVQQREALVNYLFYLGYSDRPTPERMIRAIGGGRAWLRTHFSRISPSGFSVNAGNTSAPAELRTEDEAEGSPRALRVGILCADAFRHPVGQLLDAFLGEVDRERVQVTLYDVSPKRDEVTERLQGGVRYVAAQGDTAEALAQRVAEDRIQVVMETASITNPVILEALARRCAPVQLSWGGWVYSHPLETVDGFIADERTVPDDAAARQFLQRVYRLPGCVYAYRPRGERPAPAPLPALDNGFVTFGAFNHLVKVNSSTLNLWASVLHAAPESRLVVKAATLADHETRERLAEAMRIRGISPERLSMSLPSNYLEYLQDFGKVDMLLDCVPFNGGMTTIHGLWQGVPLLALAGETHASRVGMSLMQGAGLPDWVAGSVEEYVELAQRKSADPAALARLREQLPTRLADSPLGDVRGFARQMMEVWETAWREA